MRVRRWAALAVLYLVAGLSLILGPVCLDQAGANESEEQQLLGLINKYRQDNGVGPLAPSETLSTSAERHSADMAAHDFFSHRTKESSHYPADSDPADRIVREGYPKNAATAENIAWGQPTADEVFQDWRHSPEHDAAMLDEQYTAAGVGHVDSYWTADFGSASDTSSPVDIREPEVAPEASDPEQSPMTRVPGEPATEEQTSIPKPSDERTADEQESSEQSTDEQTTGEKEAQPGETEPTTEPGEEAHRTVDVEQDGSRWTFDSDPEARDLAIETDTSDAEQTTDEETQTEEVAPVAEPGEEAAPRTPVEQPLTGQTSILQPDMQQPADEQSTGEQEPQSEALPILGPGEEAVSPQVPQLVPAQPVTEGPVTGRGATGETDLAEALRPLDAESTAMEPASTSPTQEVIRKASPVETEAMEAALTTRDAAPENPVRRPSSAPAEEFPGGIPAALQSVPATLASGGGTPGNTPVATKILPRTSGSLPLPLFVGGFLLLSGALVYAVSRKQRGR